MAEIQKALRRSLLTLLMLTIAAAVGAQDEIRLNDGGVLEGEILNVTDTEVEFKHKSFGVMRIPRSKIVQMGPYGTLGDAAEADEQAEESPSGGRPRPQEPGTTSSRLDLDYEPDRYEPVPIPGADRSAGGGQARLEAEMEARPELAGLYEAIINRELLKDEDAETLFRLNQKWENDPDSLSPLEQKIVDAFLGEADASPGDEEAENPPPEALAPLVEEIRNKLARVEQLTYRERYTVTQPEGNVVIEFERQVSPPDLVVGTGEVLEHPDAAEVGKAVRYFGDGQMMWLLTRRTAAAAGDDDESRAANPFGAGASGGGGAAPQATRAEFSAWAEAGFPVDEMTRSELLLSPFKVVDLATLEQVSEDEDAWVFRAEVDSPAFEPMRTAELRIAKDTGLLETLKLSGDDVDAELEISGARVNPDLAPATFVVPEAPEGQSFQVVKAPVSQAEALKLLGAL